MLLTNTIEEKSNKLIEVLLSSISPIVLMAGKILGIALTGLTIIGSWLLMAIVFVFLPSLLGIDIPLDADRRCRRSLVPRLLLRLLYFRVPALRSHFGGLGVSV